jgi:hypothetical protein
LAWSDPQGLISRVEPTHLLDHIEDDTDCLLKAIRLPL